MSLRTVIGGVGAGIGFLIGGPTGAHLGWALGSIAGNIADPRVVKGPQIGEISSQTSQEGGPRPIVFGLSAPMTGNIIATSSPKVTTSRQSAGKGGPKVETESVSRTYAVGVCEGPITGFVRVWRNNKLVYDGSDNPIVEPEDNEAFLENARFFVGTFDQDASPDLEAIFGVGTTPSHRGTAYMVMVDEDLTDMGGAIPQWQFQVGASGPLVTEYDEPGTYTFIANSANGYKVTVVGAGGGGSSGGLSGVTENNVAGCAGSSGDRQWATYAIGDLVGPITVIVGAGGAGGPATTRSDSPGSGDSYRLPGTAGGDSSFGALTAQGGNPGTTAGGGAVGTNGAAGGGPGPTPNGGTSGTSDGPGGGGGGAVNSDFIAHYNAGVGGDGISTTPLASVAPGGVAGTTVGDNGTNGGDGQDPSGPGYTGDPYSGVGGGGGGGGSGQGNASPNDTGGDGGRGGNGKRGGGGGGGGPAFHRSPAHVFATTGAGGSGGDGYVCVAQLAGTRPCLSLVSLVTSICERAGVPSILVDTSLLPDVCVDGITLTNQYPAVEGLRSLGQVYLFDLSPYDAQIHFIPRGGNSVATITENDMVEDDGAVEQVQREDAIVIPRVLNLNYYDTDNGGLATAKQTSERAGDRRSLGDSSIQTPVIMTADLAAKTVNIQHKVLIEETKSELKFSLPDSFLKLAPSNPIIVQWNGRSERARILQLDIHDGYQDYVCGRDRQSAYTSAVEGIPPTPPTPPPSSIPGPTLIEILDIHLLQDADDNAGLAYYVAVSGVSPAWSGAVVELSYDGGATYVESQNAEVSSVIGELATSLADHPAEYPDVVNSFTVDIQGLNPDLQDTDLTGMMNRVNLAIVDDEIINFGDVNENSAGQWELSNLLRGRKGTEAVAHSPGARFVLLERNVLGFIPSSVTDIGKTLTFRATSYGAATDTGTVVSIVYEGNIQRERAVGNLTMRRDGDYVIVSWIGVGRLGAGATAQQGARFTGYRVTLSDGSSSVEILTALQQATISALGMGNTLTATVVQLNELTGAGPEESITAYLPAVGTGGPPPSGTYEIELSGVFDTSQSFEVTALYQPTSGSAVSVTSRVLGTGKASFDDMATELKNELDAGLPAAVTVSRTGAVVTLETADGFLTITQKQLVVGLSLQQVQAPLPVTAEQLQILSIDLWTSDASIENTATGAPDSSTNYRTAGSASLNWKVHGLTWDRDKALGYGLFQNTFWTIPSNVYNYRIQALQDAPAAMMAILPQYIQSVSYSTGPGQSRATLIVYMKSGYSMETTRNWLGVIGGTHPSGYVLEIDQLVAGTADFPSGAKQRMTWSFNGTYDGDGNLHTLEEGQFLEIVLNADVYQHEVTAPEAASPNSGATAQSIIDDFRTQIELDGDFDVFVYDEDNTAGLMDIERNVANTSFTSSTSVDTGLTIEVRAV